MKTLAVINLFLKLLDIFVLESEDIRKRRIAVRKAAMKGQREIDEDKAKAKRGIFRDLD